jgi:hypothetical protein
MKNNISTFNRQKQFRTTDPLLGKKQFSPFVYCIFIKYIIPSLLLILPMSVHSQEEISYQRMDGYRGIWFELGQKTAYGDKYSGGLGTYTAKHRPMAIYDSVSHRTYFVYGGTPAKDKRHLLCMISYYDHETGQVPHPVIVFDKKGIDDPHDNPSVLIDSSGYIWVFISGRSTNRNGFKYRSTSPYAIDTFRCVTGEEFTYPQPWYIPDRGYFHFFTKYSGRRELYFETSNDCIHWSNDQKLAGIKRDTDQQAGHYQMSNPHNEKLGTFFNWHPDGDVDKRTNLYYLETEDFGKTWQTADKEKTDIPITKVDHRSLVTEVFSTGQNVYLKDMNFDQSGHPVALFITSNGHEPGPDNSLRHWKIAHWNGNAWQIHGAFTSDHNYDMGSLYIDQHHWWIIAPTEPGPQPWGVGGEIVIWESNNHGETWNKVLQTTQKSEFNNSYVRRPVNAHPDFYGFWANGNPDAFSPSKLFFMNKAGKVFELPYNMSDQYFKFNQ